MQRLFTLALGLLLVQLTFAQQQAAQDKARVHLTHKAAEWGLTVDDVRDVVLNDAYTSKHNGVQHFYFWQRYAGIPLQAAINGVHLNADNEIVFATNTFEANLAARVNTTEPTITAEAALEYAFAELGVTDAVRPVLKEQVGRTYTFQAQPTVHNDVKVELRYQPVRETGAIVLCWNMSLDLAGTADYWSVRIDAQTGKLVSRHNYTSYSHSEEDRTATHSHYLLSSQTKTVSGEPLAAPSMIVTDNASYNVFPLPAESPIHGERELIVNPADPVASPFGWHDIDGEAGAEYTITRGNNAHAYLDLAGFNSSLGDEPDGGDDLVFDTYFDLNDEAENLREAVVVQLFYTVNMIHDISFAYGFDEAAGNFQRTNYTGAAGGGDHIIAEAQDNSTSIDPSFNNANFSTPIDGVNGRMQMFIWNGVAGNPLAVAAPESVAGGYSVGTAEFAPVPEVPVVGELVNAL
ncbi:MAG: M36 family metallopeptidase, partial [Bacteroidota bacterium]